MKGLSALDTALELLRRGLWPVAIYPPGVKRKGRDDLTKGKEPIGEKWGTERWTEERLRNAFRKHPTAGVGICFGPGRGPAGTWSNDIEGDGPQATESLAILFGGEPPPTMGWSSTRGGHGVFTCDGDRLLKLLAAAGAKEGSGTKVGVWHLEALPDLEFRVGGVKANGEVKQVQSVVPPTLGTDGQPRQWNAVGTIAELPDSAYATLEAIAERVAVTKRQTTVTRGMGMSQRPPGR